MSDNNQNTHGTADGNHASKSFPSQIGWVAGAEYACIEKSKRLVLGSPSGTFEEKPRCAKQPGKNSHRHDLVADIARIGDMLVMGASLRGAMHYGLRTVRQDSFAIGGENNTNACNWIIAAIADGVSAAAGSHTFADYMARQAVIVIGEELNSNPPATLHDVKWRELVQRLVVLSDEYCRTAAKRIVPEDKAAEVDKALPKDFAQKWATTLEFAVVRANGGGSNSKNEFAHIAVAGDGAAYVLNKKHGWNTIKAGKKQSGALASNAVLSLPLAPLDFSATFGYLNKNDCLILTTDGLGDFIGDGNSQLGGFFQNKLPDCESLASFLQIADVSLYQADDDRSIVLVRSVNASE